MEGQWFQSNSSPVPSRSPTPQHYNLKALGHARRQVIAKRTIEFEEGALALEANRHGVGGLLVDVAGKVGNGLLRVRLGAAGALKGVHTLLKALAQLLIRLQCLHTLLKHFINLNANKEFESWGVRWLAISVSLPLPLPKLTSSMCVSLRACLEARRLCDF